MILNPFSWRARMGAASEDDHSVGVVVLFLLALVFAPIIGLHIALATSQATQGPVPLKADIAQHPSSNGVGG